MNLLVIRHADAVPLGEDGLVDDSVRPLTDKGRQQSKALAIALQKRAIAVDAVWSSGLVRAVQTAEEMLSHCKQPAPMVQRCDLLAPGAESKKLGKHIRSFTGNTLALVGHQPDLSYHSAWLIGSKKAQLDFAKAGVALIAVDGKIKKGAGTLVWLLTPEWFE